MESKILVLSHPKLTSVVQNVIASHPSLPRIVIRDVSFGRVVDFLDHYLQADKPTFIVTGGAHLKQIHQSNMKLDIPVIPIPITKFDLMQASLQARQYGKRAALFYFGEDIIEGKEIMREMGIECSFHPYYSKEAAYQEMQLLKQDGVEVILGTGSACALAEAADLPSIFLHSKESISQILERVHHLELSRQQIEHSAKQWSIEFIKSSLFHYDNLQESAEQFKRNEPVPLQTTNSSIDKVSTVEQFLFHEPISSMKSLSYSTEERENMFFDDFFPYFSSGSIVFNKTSPKILEKVWTVFHEEKSAKIFPVYHQQECRFIMLSSAPFQLKDWEKYFSLAFSERDYYGGISKSLPTEEVFEPAEHIVSLFWETLASAELVKNAYVTEKLHTFDDSSSYTFLLNTMRTAGLPEPQLLSPLLNKKNKEKLLHTLRLLLNHGLSITIVSQHLGTSRQTVYAAMEKIESLIGSLSDPEKRFALSIEIRAYTLRKIIKTLAVHPLFLKCQGSLKESYL